MPTNAENEARNPVLHLVRHRVVEYYRGRLPFAESFWIYFVAISVLLATVANVLHGMAATDFGLLDYLLIFLGFNVLVYAWQVCGVWRASERALSEHSSVVWVRGAQIVIVGSSLVIVSHFMGYVYLSLQEHPLEPTEHIPHYSMTVSSNGAIVRIEGEIHFGMTHDLVRLLEEHESISVVTLNSPGGIVSEARGLSVVIRRHQLTTHADDSCVSACTHVYVSGSRRLLGPGARLGFHRYRLDSPYVSLFLDPLTEQQADVALFHEQDIESDFIDRILATPNHDTWFPSQQELLNSGVVHEIGSPL